MTVIGNANNSDDPKNQKFKFIVAETKAKLMFDLASSHQFFKIIFIAFE